MGHYDEQREQAETHQQNLQTMKEVQESRAEPRTVEFHPYALYEAVNVDNANDTIVVVCKQVSNYGVHFECILGRFRGELSTTDSKNELTFWSPPNGDAANYKLNNFVVGELKPVTDKTVDGKVLEVATNPFNENCWLAKHRNQELNVMYINNLQQTDLPVIVNDFRFYADGKSNQYGIEEGLDIIEVLGAFKLKPDFKDKHL